MRLLSINLSKTFPAGTILLCFKVLIRPETWAASCDSASAILNRVPLDGKEVDVAESLCVEDTDDVEEWPITWSGSLAAVYMEGSQRALLTRND